MLLGGRIFFARAKAAEVSADDLLDAADADDPKAATIELLLSTAR